MPVVSAKTVFKETNLREYSQGMEDTLIHTTSFFCTARMRDCHTHTLRPRGKSQWQSWPQGQRDAAIPGGTPRTPTPAAITCVTALLKSTWSSHLILPPFPKQNSWWAAPRVAVSEGLGSPFNSVVKKADGLGCCSEWMSATLMGKPKSQLCHWEEPLLFPTSTVPQFSEHCCWCGKRSCVTLEEQCCNDAPPKRKKPKPLCTLMQNVAGGTRG